VSIRPAGIGVGANTPGSGLTSRARTGLALAAKVRLTASSRISPAAPGHSREPACSNWSDQAISGRHGGT
jgi:hypothetical protein